MHWGKGARIVSLHAAKIVTGSFLPYNKADGMDNGSDSINPSFCCGGLSQEMNDTPPSNSPCHLAVFLFNFSPLLLFSFTISYCWCFEPLSLPTSHLDIISLASNPGSYTPCLRCQLSHLWAQCNCSLRAVLQGVVLACRVQTLAAAEWKGRMSYGFKSLPSRSAYHILHVSEAWHVT